MSGFYLYRAFKERLVSFDQKAEMDKVCSGNLVQNLMDAAKDKDAIKAQIARDEAIVAEATERIKFGRKLLGKQKPDGKGKTKPASPTRRERRERRSKPEAQAVPESVAASTNGESAA
jgi:hypothetical protein